MLTMSDEVAARVAARFPDEMQTFQAYFSATGDIERADAYGKLLQVLGSEVLGRGVDSYQDMLRGQWTQCTDHPFPHDLVLSPALSTRMKNLSVIHAVLTPKKDSAFDRDTRGIIMMEQLAIHIPVPYIIVSPDELAIAPRPVTKSVLCQEKLFKKLTGDSRPIPKTGICLGRAYADNTRNSECTFVEPVGTCGIYEYEARILRIDSQSIMKNSDGLSFIDLRVSSEVKVYDLEILPKCEISDLVSLHYGMAWRVKSFAVDESRLNCTDTLVFVEKVHQNQHAVTVTGPWFPTPQLFHMGSGELPPFYSFMRAKIYQSEYAVESRLMLDEDEVFHFEIPNNTNAVEELCCRCKGPKLPYYSMSNAVLLSDQEVEEANSACKEKHNTTLMAMTRVQKHIRLDTRKCLDCDKLTLPKEGVVPKKSQKKESGRQRRDNMVPESSHAVRRSRRSECVDTSDYNSNQSSEMNVAPAVSEEIGEYVINQLPLEVAKPDPIRCSLCLTDIQPGNEAYFKLSCLEDCRLFLHKKCLVDSLAGQGLRKKREYKDGACPTEGCSAQIQDIHEYSIRNEELLYLKCAEKSRNGKNSSQHLCKDDKKKENTSKVKDQINVPQLVAVPNDVQDEKENMPAVELPGPPTSSLPVRAAWRPVLPPPKPNRSVPLPVDIENVVPLVKEKDALEDKYAVPEQHHRRTKPPSNKKKVVLDIPIGFRREQRQEGHDQSVSEVPVKKGRGRRRSKVQQHKTVADTPQPENNCSICLETMGEWENVLWCPACIEGYHSQCVRTWLSTNATCPQCRQNWPDPVAFPALGEH